MTEPGTVLHHNNDTIIRSMSDFQRSFAKTHLAQLPPDPAPIFDEREEEDEVPGLPLGSPRSDSSSSASSTGTVVPSPGKNLFERPKGYVS
jgi:protein phosphatase methylesterase 1